MATSKPDDLPTSSPRRCYKALILHEHEDYIVLQYHRRPETPWKRCYIACALSFIAFTALLYIIWPSDPDFKIVRMHVNRMQVHTAPVVVIDVSLLMTLRVSNADVYSFDYTTFHVAVGYRGKMLGHVWSHQGHVRARGSSYVDAELELDAVEVFPNLVYLLEDLAKGSVPFDTVTEVTGQLGFLSFHFPLKAKVSCEVLVNTINQTIGRQNCYSKEH